MKKYVFEQILLPREVSSGMEPINIDFDSLDELLSSEFIKSIQTDMFIRFSKYESILIAEYNGFREQGYSNHIRLGLVNDSGILNSLPGFFKDESEEHPEPAKENKIINFIKLLMEKTKTFIKRINHYNYDDIVSVIDDKTGMYQEFRDMYLMNYKNEAMEEEYGQDWETTIANIPSKDKYYEYLIRTLTGFQKGEKQWIKKSKLHDILYDQKNKPHKIVLNFPGWE